MRASFASGFSVEVIESKFARRSAVRSSALLDDSQLPLLLLSLSDLLIVILMAVCHLEIDRNV